MDVAGFRDWVIIILGILDIILIVGLIVVILIIYYKINKVITKVKEIVKKAENFIASPYFKAGSWLLSAVAAGLGIFQKRKSKGD